MNRSNGFTWKSAGVTSVGNVRRINEDAFLERPEAGLWVVADGMGGHDAGDLASQTIIDCLATIYPTEEITSYVERVQDSLREVNRALIDTALTRGGTRTIGSTVAVLVALDGRCACLWAGDSRVYRLRNGILQSITRDHSQVEELVAGGVISREEAESHPAANVITRAVGAFENLVVDVQYQDLRSGDRYLLCSDGLYKEISEREIAHAMQFENDSASVTQSLLQLVLQRGARDNVSVVMIEFESVQYSR